MKITNLEVNENNVKSAPDTLKAEGNVTTREIKHIFDKLPELIVDRFNAFVDYVTGGYYTKEQTDAVISQRVVDIGSADMQKSVYDKDNDGVVDNALKAVNAENAYSFDGKNVEYFAAKTEVEAARTAAETAQTTADGKADISHIQSADTISEGTFAGDVEACSNNRDTSCLRNTEIRTTGTNGELQSTNKIIMVRK